jgi:hypothetical protein
LFANVPQKKVAEWKDLVRERDGDDEEGRRGEVQGWGRVGKKSEVFKTVLVNLGDFSMVLLSVLRGTGRMRRRSLWLRTFQRVRPISLCFSFLPWSDRKTVSLFPSQSSLTSSAGAQWCRPVREIASTAGEEEYARFSLIRTTTVMGFVSR